MAMTDENNVAPVSQQGLLQYAKIKEIIEMSKHIVKIEWGPILFEKLS